MQVAPALERSKLGEWRLWDDYTAPEAQMQQLWTSRSSGCRLAAGRLQARLHQHRHSRSERNNDLSSDTFHKPVPAHQARSGQETRLAATPLTATNTAVGSGASAGFPAEQHLSARAGGHNSLQRRQWSSLNDRDLLAVALLEGLPRLPMKMAQVFMIIADQQLVARSVNGTGLEVRLHCTVLQCRTTC